MQMQALRCRCSGTRCNNAAGNCSVTHQQGVDVVEPDEWHVIAQALGPPHNGQRVGSMLALASVMANF
jgi:hypothetical protein